MDNIQLGSKWRAVATWELLEIVEIQDNNVVFADGEFTFKFAKKNLLTSFRYLKEDQTDD